MCLGLPSDDGERNRLRREYADKLRTHRQGLHDDPLSETRLEEASAPVRRDIAGGLGFPASHPFSATAAQSSASSSAEAVRPLPKSSS